MNERSFERLTEMNLDTITVQLAPTAGSTHVLNRSIASRPTIRIRPRRTRRGGGITDLLLAAVIAIIILGGLFALFQSVMRTIYDSRLNSMITRAASVIERSYSNSIIYPSGSMLATLGVSGAFGDDEVQKVGANYIFVTPYGGDITIVGSGARTYTITANNLPDHACSNLLTTYTDGATTLVGMAINGTALTAPFTQGAIDTACDNDENDVALTF